MGRFLLLLILLNLFSCQDTSENWHGGSDQNKNGVRDDIESWIDEKFVRNKDVHSALMKLAAVDPASCEYKDSLACLNQVSPDALIIQLELLEKVLDTPERRVSFEKRVQKCVVLDDRNLNIKCNF